MEHPGATVHWVMMISCLGEDPQKTDVYGRKIATHFPRIELWLVIDEFYSFNRFKVTSPIMLAQCRYIALPLFQLSFRSLISESPSNR